MNPFPPLRFVVVLFALATGLTAATDAQLFRMWRTYASSGDGPFSLSFPSRAKVERFDASIVWRGTKEPAVGFRAREADRQWSIAYLKNVTYPAFTTRERRLQQALDAYTEETKKALEGASGRVISITPITWLEKHPGRRVVIVTADQSMLERQIFLVDTILYELEFGLRPRAEAGLDGDMFFGSFKLTVAFGATPLPKPQ